MQNEDKFRRLALRSSLCILTCAFVLSCAENGPTPTHHQVRRDDTPFGGGFPANQRPSNDPYGRDAQRQELRLSWPDARVREPRSESVEKYMQQRQ